MSETKESSGKMHRVSISLSDDDLNALVRLCRNGYKSCHKPTTLAARIVSDFLWDEYGTAKEAVVARNGTWKE